LGPETLAPLEIDRMLAAAVPRPRIDEPTIHVEAIP
jgi:hypothetical protein